MSTVLLLYEDSHGFVAVCQNYNAAIDYLIKGDWLDGMTEVRDSATYDWRPIHEVLGENWEVEVRKMDIMKFNRFFEACFSIECEPIYGAE